MVDNKRYFFLFAKADRVWVKNDLGNLYSVKYRIKTMEEMRKSAAKWDHTFYVLNPKRIL